MSVRTDRPTTWPAPRVLGRAAIALLAILSAAPASSAVRYRIHPPEEILADAARAAGIPTTATAGARLQFTDLGGRTWDLITDIEDPSITNRGSGKFHPANLAEVERAIADLRDEAMNDFQVDVFILPYPRRGLLASSAGEGAIYLSPGVHPYAAVQLHMLVAHELGHVFQYRFLPDANAAAWSSYRDIRGLADASIYNESASHRNRPHEIFAEDFRVLFGGALANYSSSIENSQIGYPTSVPALEPFILGLAAATADAGETFGLVSTPNPFNPLTTIRFRLPEGSHRVELEIVDAAGRLVRQLAGEVLGEGTYEYRWDGRTTEGSRAASGVYFARLSADVTRTHYKLILTR